MAVALLTEQLVVSLRDLGLGGFVLSGAATPSTVNGEYVRGIYQEDTSYGGKPLYIHVDETMVVWWNTATSKWTVGPSAGSATVYFTRTDASPVGAYTAVTGTGTLTGAYGTVWANERNGNGSQTIVRLYGGAGHPDMRRALTAADIQCVIHHTDSKVCEARATAILHVLEDYKGSTNKAAGWDFSGMTAQSLTIDPPIFFGLTPIGGGKDLYTATLNLHLINLVFD